MVAVLSGVVYFFMVQNAAPVPQVAEVINQMPVPAARMESNSVVVIEQKPGTTASLSLVQLSSPGFVVIHEDAAGSLGAVLGASALLPAGENLNISVSLSTSTTDGQKLHAALYSDTNGDSSFTAGTDRAIIDSLGNPLDGWFDISTTASTGTPITI